MPTDATRYLSKRRTSWRICLWIIGVVIPRCVDACELSQDADLIGKAFTPELGRQILKVAKATVIRVLPPNEPISGEWRSDRVNVQIDAAGTILQIRCG